MYQNIVTLIAKKSWEGRKTVRKSPFVLYCYDIITVYNIVIKIVITPGSTT